jgi:hypothetical protein
MLHVGGELGRGRERRESGMREYNRNRAPADQLRFYGFDAFERSGVLA